METFHSNFSDYEIKIWKKTLEYILEGTNYFQFFFTFPRLGVEQPLKFE